MLSFLNALTANTVIDGVIVLLCLIYAIVSAKKGFIKCLFGLISTVAAIIIALTLSKTLVEKTRVFGLVDVIENAFISVLNKIEAFTVDVSNEGLTELLKEKGLPNFLITVILDTVGDNPIEKGTTIAMLVGEATGKLGGTLIAFLLVFILCKIVLSLLGKLLNTIISKIPIMGALNIVLGGVFGAIKGFFVLSLIFAVFSILPIPAIGTFFTSSVIGGWLYSHNPIFYLLSLIV